MFRISYIDHYLKKKVTLNNYFGKVLFKKNENHHMKMINNNQSINHLVIDF
jgi:hypothetical protein